METKITLNLNEIVDSMGYTIEQSDSKKAIAWAERALLDAIEGGLLEDVFAHAGIELISNEGE